MQRCGYIALLGRPNVGKSTLLNALVGAKLAGVSSKAQTTRNQIVGLWVEEGSQAIFLDTPGFHVTDGKPYLNKLMVNEAWRAAKDADFLCYLIEAPVGVLADDIGYLQQLLRKSGSRQVIPMITKMDLLKKKDQADAKAQIKAQLREGLGEELYSILREPMWISAKNRDQVRELRTLFCESLPEGPWLFSGDQLTDRSQKFIVGEYIREQMFRLFGDELPYASGVIVEHVDFSSRPVHVHADIYVERESQKRMVIGGGGQKIKKIGQNSRALIEELFDAPVYLELFVKVKPGWMDKKRLIEEISQLGED